MKTFYFIFLFILFSVTANAQVRAESSREEFCTEALHPKYDSIASNDDAFIIEPVPAFNTVRQFPKSGRIPANAKFRAFVLHGNGAKYSNSDAMRPALRLLSDNGYYKSSSNTARIRQYEKFVAGAAEAIDLPVHRFGDDAENHTHPAMTAAYLARYLEQMKRETPDLPFIIFTRSSSPVLIFDVIKTHPGLIDAFVMMSPTVPIRDWIIESSLISREREKQGLMQLNHAGLEWIDNMLLQSTWDTTTLKNIPTLILTGTHDWEMSPMEREFFKALQAHSPATIRYQDIQNAEHDVLRDTEGYDKKAVLKTMMAIEDFLFDVVNSRR